MDKIEEAMNSKSMKNMIELSFGEEVGNAITHGVMAFICLVILPVVAIKAYLQGPSLEVSTIFL